MKKKITAQGDLRISHFSTTLGGGRRHLLPAIFHSTYKTKIACHYYFEFWFSSFSLPCLSIKNVKDICFVWKQKLHATINMSFGFFIFVVASVYQKCQRHMFCLVVCRIHRSPLDTQNRLQSHVDQDHDANAFGRFILD
jgi:hypothetical protein